MFTTHNKYLNKRKIINDPVYGFINFQSNLIFDIVEHPWFQRLRRIKQLGLTELVYPGAKHSRFHHALGAMHLMQLAIESLMSKGIKITEQEKEGAFLAILLHDIGHGPFSHSLEHNIINATHEDLSKIFIQKLNIQFNGALDTAYKIFIGTYPKNFLHQLVSSQLDVDRLDYLRRDSFFTGVTEGVVSSDRIIKMLDVDNDKLVVEKKGIYSIEKFLIARRLMYWQVYLHKTVHSVEQMLLSILKRAKFLAKNNIDLFATPAFKYFLYNDIDLNSFNKKDNNVLDTFALLDDNDLISSIKVWTSHKDKILSMLCSRFINRNLFKNIIQDTPFDNDLIEDIKKKTAKKLNISISDIDFFVKSDTIKNSAYSQDTDKILIKEKNNTITEIVNVADMVNIKALSGTVSKYYLCYPKDI